MYEIIYDYGDAQNIRDIFEGDWTALKAHIRLMREDGCYNIDATSLEEV